MPSIKDIQHRIASIRDTMKITKAMYLISSAKLRKARNNLAAVADYFNTMQATIHDILTHMPEIEHPYLESYRRKPETDKKRGYIVVTADKGLAGAYNQNVIKLLEKELEGHPNSELFVIGEIGRHYFMGKPVIMNHNFLYSSQNPSLQRARNITRELLDLYEEGGLDEIHIIYSDMRNAMQSVTKCIRVLPLKRVFFAERRVEDHNQPESFFPSPESVMDQTVPNFMYGAIFAALTESYCAELSNRMAAMDTATNNGADMLAELSTLYNRTRQGEITQEITEVIGGYRAQKNSAP